jgi:LacI family transcriptional regulator
MDEFQGDNGLRVHFLDSDFYPQSGYLAVRRFLENDTVDAVFCANDWQASGVIGALAEKNLLVGKDVALVGFGNYTEKLTAYFPLSTVDQNLRRIGMSASEAIIKASRGQQYDQTIVIETKLIIRKT